MEKKEGLEKKEGRMIYKRATRKLRDAGIEHLQVIKGVYGPYLYDPRANRQQSTCHKTTDDCVSAAIKGERPRIDADVVELPIHAKAKGE